MCVLGSPCSTTFVEAYTAVLTLTIQKHVAHLFGSPIFGKEESVVVVSPIYSRLQINPVLVEGRERERGDFFLRLAAATTCVLG